MHYTCYNRSFLKRKILEEIQSDSELTLAQHEHNARESITYFSHHFLGITPYTYQYYLFQRMLKKRRVICCKSRQIGISIAFAIFAIWSVFFNKFPSSIYKNTKVAIVSKSEKQSKKLLREILNILYTADGLIAQKTNGAVKQYFMSKVLHKNKSEIWLKSNCWIKCFPPTDAIRGESCDIVIVDEGAFVDDDVFTEAIEPTVSATGGRIYIGSTPKGQAGFFFELFDPFDVLSKHEYDRLWFNWHMCENRLQKKIIREKFENAKLSGNLKSFDQEYNALFTVDQSSFFTDKMVESGIDPDATMEYFWKSSPCVIAIDYGMQDSATVITVKTKFNRKIRTLFQWGKKDFDENLLLKPEFEHSIPTLMKRYNVWKIVVDDCPQGSTINKELENKGYPVVRFNFRSDQTKGDRNRGYYMYRYALKRGLIKYPRIKELIHEMKILQEVQLKTTVAIHAPRGYNDDRIDSEMMAAIPFLMEDEGSFESYIVDPLSEPKEEKEESYGNQRIDTEWLELTGGLEENA